METLAAFDTVETADCVESCPVAGFESSMIVATYQLHKAAEIGEAQDRRSGTLLHFQLECNGAINTDDVDVVVCKLEETVTSSGIFDIKWNTQVMNGKAVLGAATAAGSLELYELVQEGKKQTLHHSGHTADADAASMCLSLDWNNRVHANAQPSICSSHSDGILSVWEVAPHCIIQRSKWQAHDLYGSPIEAWISAFNCHDPNVLFSGADDAVLKGWDLRAGTAAPTFKNSRQYSMGVCSIQFHPHDERLVAAGSYDEQVVVWDNRNMTRPMAVHGAGGGVWRLKWHPAESRKELLLAACMHNGFQVLDFMTGNSTLRKVASYDRHDSLAYGVDWWLHPAALMAKAPIVAHTRVTLPSSVVKRNGQLLPSTTTNGVKRSLDRMMTGDKKTSSTTAIATSMLSMRTKPKNPIKHVRTSGTTVTTSTRRNPIAQTVIKKEQETTNTTTLHRGPKKTKVSRERQLKINAASRRCRKKQKMELQFLRTHVVELQAALKDQVKYLQGQLSQQQRAARLANFVEDSIQKVEEMSSGVRLHPTVMPATPLVSFSSDLLPFKMEDHSGEDTDGTHSNDSVNHIETDDANSVHIIDPCTGYSLSDERKKVLLNISSFVRVNMSLESSSFAPEVISCLPIEMDGWQLRLAITEKNYTIHNQKFFPCNVEDMFDFCWETNVAQKISIKHAKKHYVVVTPLDKDVAHVYSKTTGKWSLYVHGVPNVSYNSIVCRRFIPGEDRAIICQQSVLEERDFQDENTLPWLFKRWVVFRPKVQDGIKGTIVEAYRTASYATGRLIYKENKTYDSFCEHLIRRYAESNTLLEGMMARDKRFAHAFDASVRSGVEAESATVSDRMIKDLLLF
ncbi:unnamed protein product [Peronospora belbahrii]|uniref:methylated diphthine methylhydrolase n=1 Tax=Peronospora belbahrii TaxID=622444 RepID=A0ABN8D5M3_9STRA|nr:unnamed protein product [Peronospora belbahrii]